MDRVRIHRLLLCLAFVGLLWLPILQRPRSVMEGLWSSFEYARAEGRDAPQAAEADFIRRFPSFLGPLHDQARLALFGEGALEMSGVSQVVMGSQGWLFYHAERANDGHTLDSLRGAAPWPAEDLAATVAELRRRDAVCAEWGGRYLVVAIPNKEAVYPGLLPAWYRPAAGARSRLDQLAAVADRERFLDLRPAMAAARSRSPVPLYWRTDSHWNDWGGFLGFLAIQERLAGMGWKPAVSATACVPVVQAGRGVVVSGESKEGDTLLVLRRSLGQVALVERFGNEDVVTVVPAPASSARLVEANLAGQEFVPMLGGHRTAWAETRTTSWRNEGAPNPGPLLVVHDSFGWVVQPWLNALACDSGLVWSHRFDEADLRRRRPALLLHLVVERYLDVLRPGAQRP